MVCAMQVLGPISCIRGNTVEFEDGKKSDFDSLVFATGYRSTANTWLKVQTNILTVVTWKVITLIFCQYSKSASY